MSGAEQSAKQIELDLLTMLEVNMNNGDIDPSKTDWASQFKEELGKSKASQEFKTKCIFLIVNYNELRREGLPHYLAVQELKNEKLEARVTMNEARVRMNKTQIQQIQEHTRQIKELEQENASLQKQLKAARNFPGSVGLHL